MYRSPCKGSCRQQVGRRRRLTGVVLASAVAALILLYYWTTTLSSPSPATRNSSEVSHSKEISDVLSEMRLLLFAEMVGNQYPKGLNETARLLAGLVPEQGGQPIRNVIISTWRSGSTFLGAILDAYPANFYHYEPLLNYGIKRIRVEPSASEAVAILKALLNCNYTGLHSYLYYGKNRHELFSHNTRLWEQCLEHPSLCWLPEFLNPICKLFPIQSMKTVRLKLSLADSLLADTSLNVRVVLLVRDPRGTMQSRKHRTWCPGSPDCSGVAILCSDLTADHATAKAFAVKYPNRFRVVRYEDLSVKPYREVEELLQFFGLHFHPKIHKFLDTHTKTNLGGLSSVFRNSSAAPFHWRQELSFQEVHALQVQCKQAMDAWGYVKAMSPSHQRVFNPISDYKLLL